MLIINELGYEGFDKGMSLLPIHFLDKNLRFYSDLEFGTKNQSYIVWTLKWTCRHPAQKATISR